MNNLLPEGLCQKQPAVIVQHPRRPARVVPVGTNKKLTKKLAEISKALYTCSSGSMPFERPEKSSLLTDLEDQCEQEVRTKTELSIAHLSVEGIKS